jgi:hypothetical protein
LPQACRAGTEVMDWRLERQVMERQQERGTHSPVLSFDSGTGREQRPPAVLQFRAGPADGTRGEAAAAASCWATCTASHPRAGCFCRGSALQISSCSTKIFGRFRASSCVPGIQASHHHTRAWVAWHRCCSVHVPPCCAAGLSPREDSFFIRVNNGPTMGQPTAVLAPDMCCVLLCFVVKPQCALLLRGMIPGATCGASTPSVRHLASPCPVIAAAPGWVSIDLNCCRKCPQCAAGRLAVHAAVKLAAPVLLALSICGAALMPPLRGVHWWPRGDFGGCVGWLWRHLLWGCIVQPEGWASWDVWVPKPCSLP